MHIPRRQRFPEPRLTRNGIQEDRAHLLAWLAALHPAVLLEDPAEDQPPVLSLTANGHTTLWIIAPHEAPLFDYIHHADSEAPGMPEFWEEYRHTDKLAAVRSHIRSLGRVPGPSGPG